MNNTQFQTGDLTVDIRPGDGFPQESDQFDSEIANHNSHCINALDELKSNNPEVIEIINQQPINPDLCFENALLVLDDQLQSLRDEIIRLMNKSAEQGNVKVNHAFHCLCLATDLFHCSV